MRNQRLLFWGPGGAPFLTLPGVLLLVLAGADWAWAGRVEFDVDRSVVAREVFAESDPIQPGHIVIELTLRISARFRDLAAAAVDQIDVEITGANPRFRVLSYSPTTQLSSDVVGEIQTTQTIERERSWGATLGGAVPLPIGDLVAQLSPSASASDSRHEVRTETTKRLPPKTAVLVSGTASRGRGVFYALRPSSQATMEGEHTFIVRFSVPSGFRSDQLQVKCRATGKEEWLWLHRDRVWGKSSADVGIFLEGDPVAQLKAAYPRRHAVRRPIAATRGKHAGREECPCWEEVAGRAQRE